MKYNDRTQVLYIYEEKILYVYGLTVKRLKVDYSTCSLEGPFIIVYIYLEIDSTQCPVSFLCTPHEIYIISSLLPYFVISKEY